MSFLNRGYDHLEDQDPVSPYPPSRGLQDFSRPDFWNSRFEKDGAPFDWLIPAEVLRDFSIQALGERYLENAEVLHIGCGTSRADALRDLVRDPAQINNVDFSDVAIEAASKRADEASARNKAPLVDAKVRQKHDSVNTISLSPQMRWSCLDLLSLDSIFYLLDQQAQVGRLYDVVLDKSTSDSISCGPDLRVSLPYQIQRWARGTTSIDQVADVHPINVLAVHLAALTKPRTGRWLVISNSMDRFPFAPPFARSRADGFLSNEVIAGGFPHPKRLWTLERKEEIEISGDETLAERRRRLQSGRPKPSPFLYVLRRTDVIVTD